MLYGKVEDTKGVIRSRKSKEKRTGNTMAKREEDRQYNGQKRRGQAIQWPKEKGQMNKQ
jgi:hypothetical protein